MEKNKQIINMLLSKCGVDVDKYDEAFLCKSMQKRLNETHCDNEEDYYKLLEKSKSEEALFIDSLNISYSAFFRNTLTYAVMERLILPMLIQKKSNSKNKEIRIWSAACAGGQEAYSMAILLEELKINNNFNYRIFATDQSKQQIEEAQKGNYSDAALSNINLKRVNQWFTKHKNLFTIKQVLKEKIDFSVFDLFNEQLSAPPASIFGNFDIVICANLLFYYKNEYRNLILEKATRCISEDGYIMTGEVEREILSNNKLKEVVLYSAIFQRK